MAKWSRRIIFDFKGRSSCVHAGDHDRIDMAVLQPVKISSSGVCVESQVKLVVYRVLFYSWKPDVE